MTLANKRCAPCTGSTPSLSREEATAYLAELPGWKLDDDGKSISAAFAFNNFHESMGFANAVAWMANQEDHHPDLEVSYKRCVVRYTTHAVDGLSENDVICAAKVQRLYDPSGGDQGSR
jgi:4a-hydroxytetrahydrobiopterin dehydratase